MALSTFFSGWGIPDSAFSADLKEKPLFLRYASFHRISDGHYPFVLLRFIIIFEL